MRNNDKPEGERTIWGKVLNEMKSREYYDIHSICVNIGTIAVINNKFCIITNFEKNLETLKDEQNYRNLVACFVSLGYNYNVEILYRPAPSEVQMQKVHELEHILGQKIIIKD